MQNKIFNLLKNSDGYISGQSISETLGITRQAVWKNISAMRDRGYCVESVPNKGYKLISTPDCLCSEIIKSHLTTKVLGQELYVCETTNSTNEKLKDMENKNKLSDGTTVVTREQTNGKGRLGRAWICKKDENITFSILIKPKLSPMEVSAITPLVGLAVCKAISDYCNIFCKIKWPNDIIVGSKKLVGILTEMSAEFDAVEYIISGIGINIDQENFPKDIAQKATSVFLETGKHIDKNELLAVILQYIENVLYKNNFRLTYESIEEYKKLCATVDRKVSFRRGQKSISGMAVGIESNGELKVMLDDGSIVTVNAGEVTVQGIY